MEVAKELYASRLTPGEYGLKILKSGKKYIPEFFRSDLQAELDKIWEVQRHIIPKFLPMISRTLLQEEGKTTSLKFSSPDMAFIPQITKASPKLAGISMESRCTCQSPRKDVLAYVIAGLSGAIKIPADI